MTSEGADAKMEMASSGELAEMIMKEFEPRKARAVPKRSRREEEGKTTAAIAALPPTIAKHGAPKLVTHAER